MINQSLFTNSYIADTSQMEIEINMQQNKNEYS